MAEKGDISNSLQLDKKYVKELSDKWDYSVSQGNVGYNDCLLKTLILDPKDGRLPFFLIFNPGREAYIKQLNQRQDNSACPFCSEGNDLKIADLPSLIILPNKYPCLPHQYILASREHTNKLNVRYIADALRFSRSTGFKVYCNASGSGGAYVHLVFQASGKHPAAPKIDFFEYIDAGPFAEKNGVIAEVLHHTVFGVRLICDNVEKLSSITSEFMQIYDKSANIVMKGNQSYIFPRTSTETPTGLGRWKFGALEAIGIFICQNDWIFNNIEYDKLENAMKEISLSEVAEQEKIIKIIGELV